MKKYLRILLTVLIVMGVLTACGGAAAKVKVMKIAGTMSQAETDGEFTGTRKFAELVEKYSNGSIKVEIYPSSQLGSFSEFTEGVMMGSIEACVCGASAMGTSDPFLYFLEMPYLFKDLEHARNLWETDNDAKREIDEHLAKLNMISAGTLYRSPRVWCNNIRPVKSVADNKGIKMRTPESPISVALATAMGASPVTVAWSEVYTALSSGVASGVENTITELFNNNMQEVVKYVSETNHMLNTQSILVGKAWFDKLSSEEKDAIMRASKEATVWRAEQLQSEVENAWNKFSEKGVQIIKQTDLNMDDFNKAAQSVVDDYIKKGYFTQEFIDFVRSLAS
jgi:tripartite ATP-independent transporter DctP family solute receptor